MMKPGVSSLALCAMLFGQPVAAADTGHALSFDGIDDVVEVPGEAALDLTRNFTLEAWVKLPPTQDTFSATSVIVAKTTDELDWNGNYWLNIDNGSNVAIVGIGDQVAGSQFLYGTTNLGTSEWMHVAGVRSHTALKIYVNGILEASTRRSVYQQANDAPVRIGGTPTRYGSILYLGGVVDEVRIWNIARSAKDIRRTMHRSLEGTEEGLVGYWRMDKGRGQDVRDSSPTHANGTLGTTSERDSGDPLWVKSQVPAD